MKKHILVTVLLVLTGFWGTALAGSCYSDRVVKGWLTERDRSEERVVQLWARGASPDEFAPHVAVILANELYICSQCRDEKEFLEQNVHILGKASEPKVENVPGMILERFMGYDILSPKKLSP